MRRSAAVLVWLAVLAAPAQAAPTRYSLAGGCWRIGAMPTALRLQATDLGR